MLAVEQGGSRSRSSKTGAWVDGCPGERARRRSGNEWALGLRLIGPRLLKALWSSVFTQTAHPHVGPREHQAWGMERSGRGSGRPLGSGASLGRAVSAGKVGVGLGCEGPGVLGCGDRILYCEQELCW